MISPDQTKKLRKIMQTVNSWVADGMQNPPPKKVKIKETDKETRVIIRIPKPVPKVDTPVATPPTA